MGVGLITFFQGGNALHLLPKIASFLDLPPKSREKQLFRAPRCQSGKATTLPANRLCPTAFPGRHGSTGCFAAKILTPRADSSSRLAVEWDLIDPAKTTSFEAVTRSGLWSQRDFEFRSIDFTL